MNDKIKEIKAKETKLMKEYGFVIHNIFSQSKEDVLWDSHTHGLKENFNHIDLQIVLPIEPNLINSIIHSMVTQIKEGETFEDKIISDKVIANYDVQLVKIKDSDNRELLRIVLPDINGKFPCDEDCADIYKNQLDDLTEKIDDRIKN